MEARNRRRTAVTAKETQDAQATQVPIQEPAPVEGEQKNKRKSYYNPEREKARRQRIMEAAKAGGYQPKEKALAGTGATEKRVSQKTGMTYYYTPWNKLTEEQKASRLAASRERTAAQKDQAKKYREEHPELFPTDKD